MGVVAIGVDRLLDERPELQVPIVVWGGSRFDLLDVEELVDQPDESIAVGPRDVQELERLLGDGTRRAIGD